MNISDKWACFFCGSRGIVAFWRWLWFGTRKLHPCGIEHARPAEEWIDVNERLPEVGVEVWATRRADNEVVPRHFVFLYSADEFRNRFTAWMPKSQKPAPYRKGD